MQCGTVMLIVWFFIMEVFNLQDFVTSPSVEQCKKNDEDFEDLDEDVYCSIAVTKHM